MNDKLVDFLIEKTDAFGNVINELAKQMGVAAKHLYGVIVRQQYVEGITGLIGCALFFILAITLIIISTKSRAYWLKEYREGRINYSSWDDISAFRWVITGISCIVIVICIFTAVYFTKMLLNPEFYALEQIMELIRGELEK